MENLIFITSLVAPVFLIVALGYFLRKIKLIDENFVKRSSAVVFNVSLPALIFKEIALLDISQIFNFSIITFVYSGTLFVFAFSWLVSVPLVKVLRDRTVFIQGAFRGNFAIIGLAIIANLFGQGILGKAALVLAFTIPLYNLLSVIALTVPLRKERSSGNSDLLKKVVTNPLILAVICSTPFSYFNIAIHPVLLSTVDYLADLSIPLALIGIGGFMSFNEARNGLNLTMISSFIKLVLTPLIVTYAAYLLGFRGTDLGIIFILFGCPTAIASFIMAEAMGSNGKLAANILLVTTLGSVVTMTLGLFVLKETGLI
ncbi:MAG: AEC family transporter [Ignavibacteriales bacterium]|nr:MAG: AEC family transporter [Ignavibacteriales bacterium]